MFFYLSPFGRFLCSKSNIETVSVLKEQHYQQSENGKSYRPWFHSDNLSRLFLGGYLRVLNSMWLLRLYSVRLYAFSFPWRCLILKEIHLFGIIQQIVTMPIYGKEALNICHPTWQISCDIRKWPYLEVHCRFSFIACLAAILKSVAVLAVFSVNFNSLEETFHD